MISSRNVAHPPFRTHATALYRFPIVMCPMGGVRDRVTAAVFGEAWRESRGRSRGRHGISTADGRGRGEALGMAACRRPE
jgi:hypothetical protein